MLIPQPSTAATWSRRGILLGGGAVALTGLSSLTATASPSRAPDPGPVDPGPAATTPAWSSPAYVLPTRAEIVAEFAGRKPKKFGMFLPGSVTHTRRRTALTFDACGGPRGSHYDQALIATLRRADVPATLFLNARWIKSFPSIAAELAADPLFEIASHGLNHRPLTVRGQAAYGIAGTADPGEAYDEIVGGLDAVAELTGFRPRLYRTGTAWADDVGIAIAKRIGVRVVSYSVNADAGATATRAAVVKNLSHARAKDITLAHVNQPGGQTAEGLARALPKMVHAGRRFAKLSKVLA